ncbi:MAG: DUF484 family protein [Rickettsiales bacterium]|nr:DUF484 family protein [Rickettsiales bacterium]
MAENEAPRNSTRLSEASVLHYLQEHPDFLSRHPELFEKLVPPERQTGEKISDFQQFAIKNLQQRVKKVETHFAHAVTYARDNQSAQGQIHEAVLQVIAARGLEALLETLTQDMQLIFDVDVVRLGLESEIADLYESYHPEEHYSGLVFIGAGATEVFFGEKQVLLFADTEAQGGFLIDELFHNCQRLALSCVLLRLHLPMLQRNAVIGFGVRMAGRYDATQAIDLLSFLAKVMAQRLDTCLYENGVSL